MGIPYDTEGTRVYLPDYGPLNNCVIEEIIIKRSRHDLVKLNDTTNSLWASFASDVDKKFKCEDDTSSESCVSNYKVVSKLTLVPIKPRFNNTSVGQSSKSTYDSQKKPWWNKKDIVPPKTEGRKALEK